MKQHPKYSNIKVTEDGKVFSITSQRFLKSYVSEGGYEIINLTVATNSYKKVRVHRLVAETYYPEHDERHDVHHKDHNKLNNHKDNLEWCNRSHNIKEAIRCKVNLAEGETHSQAKYTNSQIEDVCRLLSDGFRNTDISKATSVKIDTIRKIRSGEAWSHISKDYNLPKTKAKGRLSVSKVMRICKMLQNDDSNVNIALECGVSKFTVSKIRGRKIYCEVSKDYSF